MSLTGESRHVAGSINRESRLGAWLEYLHTEIWRLSRDSWLLINLGSLGTTYKQGVYVGNLWMVCINGF